MIDGRELKKTGIWFFLYGAAVNLYFTAKFGWNALPQSYGEVTTDLISSMYMVMGIGFYAIGRAIK
jgi:hypothetical protein